MTISCDADTAYNAYDAVATVIDEVWSFEIAEPVNVFSAVILVLAEPVKLFNAVISVEPPPPVPNPEAAADLETSVSKFVILDVAIGSI